MVLAGLRYRVAVSVFVKMMPFARNEVVVSVGGRVLFVIVVVLVLVVVWKQTSNSGCCIVLVTVFGGRSGLVRVTITVSTLVLGLFEETSGMNDDDNDKHNAKITKIGANIFL